MTPKRKALLLRVSFRLYRALLRLYPVAFRADYSAEMLRCFCDCCEDTYRKEGVWGLVPLWGWALADLAHTVPLAHLDEGGIGVRFIRLVDLLFASLVLFLTLPLLGLIALLIRLESAGPVLYRSVRLGKGGRPFVMYKFRTMRPTATLPPEACVTRVGRLLRRFALDELPQVVNVLRGEMAIIGPRPGLPSTPTSLDAEPGMTGLSQLGKDGLHQRSLRQDLKILLQSLLYMIRGR